MRIRGVSILLRYGLAVGGVLAASLTWRYLPAEWEPIMWFVPFILAVGISAWLGGFGPGLVATVGSTWAISHSPVRPAYVRGSTGAGDVFSVVLFFGFCLLVNALLSSNRQSSMSPF